MRNEKEVTKIVAASLLGDGYVSKLPNDNYNSRFEIKQTSDHRDHLEYIKNYTDEITTCVIESAGGIQKDGGETTINGVITTAKPALVLRTRNHPLFTKFRNRMYYTGVKSVDPHYLTLMDWEFLAVWFMQDGTYSYFPNHSREEFVLYTNGFTYGDQLLLKQALKEKLGLEWNVQKCNTKTRMAYRLYLYKKCNNDFVDGVYKFIQPSFLYKMPNDCTKSSLENKDEDIVRTANIDEIAESGRNCPDLL